MICANRARQCYTGACRPISSGFGWSKQYTPETNPLCSREICAARPVCLCNSTRRKTHGTRKTRHKTPGTAEEVPKEDKRIFPHKEQAVPVGAGSGESRGPLCEARPSREETRISPAVDSANRRGGAVEWHDLRPADSRIEGCGRGA